MKKDILLFTIIIIASFITGFLKYNHLSQSEEKKEIIPVELSYQELKKYIEYVPIEKYYNFNPYTENINISNIGDNILIAIALDKAATNECTDKVKCGENMDKKVKSLDTIYSKYYSLDYINSILKEMYNYELKDLKETTNIDNVYNSSVGKYAYEEGYFYKVGDTKTNTKLFHRNLITAYGATNEELIIEEYAGYGDELDFSIKDYRNDKSIDINYDYYDQFEKFIHNFFIEQRKEFTKYRHTFKKSESGYCWVKTEVA